MSTQKTAGDELADIGSVMTEFVAVVDLEDMAGSLRTHLGRAQEINADLLAALKQADAWFDPKVDLNAYKTRYPGQPFVNERVRAAIAKAEPS